MTTRFDLRGNPVNVGKSFRSKESVQIFGSFEYWAGNDIRNKFVYALKTGLYRSSFSLFVRLILKLKVVNGVLLIKRLENIMAHHLNNLASTFVGISGQKSSVGGSPIPSGSQKRLFRSRLVR